MYLQSWEVDVKWSAHRAVLLRRKKIQAFTWASDAYCDFSVNISTVAEWLFSTCTDTRTLDYWVERKPPKKIDNVNCKVVYLFDDVLSLACSQ